MAVPYNNRSIVEDFLCHRLRPRHAAEASVLMPLLPWRSTRVMMSLQGVDPGDRQPDVCLAPPHLQVVLRSACYDLACRDQSDLEENISALLERLAGPRGLTAVREELFKDGVNWGRIVTMMEVGGALCSEVVKVGRAWQVEVIADWLEEGLESQRGWIEDNGGWDAFMELYGGSRHAASLWSLRTLFGLAVLGAAGIMLAALFTQT